MVHAKSKGNSYERKIAKEFREKLGYRSCKTSRYASREKDDQKVDLVNTGGYNIQCKATERTPPYHTILEEMPDDGINVIIHKRNRQMEVVVMKKEDFYELIKTIRAKS